MTELVRLIDDAAGGAAGSTRLADLILGTGIGRPLAGSAAELDTLALLGRLAYRAYRDYRQGRAVSSAGNAHPSALAPAPDGSGFEPGAISHAHAILLLRAMIAAAQAAAGPEPERRQLLAALQHAGLGSGAGQFLRSEFERAATIAELARAASSPSIAVQLYAAARIAIPVANHRGEAFLLALAARLDLDGKLTRQIDAMAERVCR